MQPLRGRVAGNDNIGVIAESLDAAVPNIAMDIIIGARGQAKKFNVPHNSQNEPNDDKAPGNTWFKFRRSKNLTDRQEVGDARKRQRGHEVRPASIAEVARADR